ncbi:hypothetical protein [Nonomuraea insulae]|uniref:Cytochrome P450 n=1 Tax=Nonomuraea insulae TaxID=1616787 RepID=A0ABW1CPR0_9ACTN
MSQPLPFVIDPTGADRNAEYRALRARGPATPVDILGLRAWAVTDPAVLKTMLTSPDVSKNGRIHYPAFQQTVSTWPLALWIEVQSMLSAYGADHRRLRRMVAPAFGARRIAKLRPIIRSLVTELLDDLAEVPAGQVVDLRERLAYPLPIAVIGHLMGVPEDQRDHFRKLVDNVFDSTLTPEEAQANAARLFESTDHLIATKRADPGDDMTSLLIAMLTSPDQLHLVRTGRATWEDVVEETLRHEPAIKYLPPRFAVTDVKLPDGQIISAGSRRPCVSSSSVSPPCRSRHRPRRCGRCHPHQQRSPGTSRTPARHRVERPPGQVSISPCRCPRSRRGRTCAGRSRRSPRPGSSPAAPPPA